MPRPRENLRPADYEFVEACAAEPTSKATCAKRLGIRPVTFRNILKRDSKAGDAWEYGRGEWETRMLKTLETAGNRNLLTGAIFSLKTLGYSDQPKAAPADNRVAIVFQMPAALDRGKYEKVIDAGN